MSTVVEIKAAIDGLSSDERAKLESLLWPDEETPPGVHDKLAEALAGNFAPGDRANIEKVLSNLK